MKLFVYYRLSRKKKGSAGLGLDARAALVASYVASVGGEIVKDYTEIESGTGSGWKRDELSRAIIVSTTGTMTSAFQMGTSAGVLTAAEGNEVVVLSLLGW